MEVLMTPRLHQRGQVIGAHVRPLGRPFDPPVAGTIDAVKDRPPERAGSLPASRKGPRPGARGLSALQRSAGNARLARFFDPRVGQRYAAAANTWQDAAQHVAHFDNDLDRAIAAKSWN